MKKCKALIVDDEYTGRELIKKLVNWDKIGYEKPDLAVNGAEALQKMQNHAYTIIFTDIEMPVMNGLDFIRIARKEFDPKNIIVISCHEKFAYAKEAMKLGVKEYIIKDLVLKHELETLAISAKHDIEEYKQMHSWENKFVYYLKQAILGNVIPNENLPCKFVSVFKISLDDYDKLCFDIGDDVIDSVMLGVLKKLDCLAAYYDSNGSIYAIYETWETDSVLYSISVIYNIAQGIRDNIKDFEQGNITIGVSNLINNVKDLEMACREADKAVDMRIIQGTGKTILYKNIELKKSLVNMEQISILLKRIENLWMAGNMDFLPLIDKLYQYDISSGFADVNYYYYINMQLWNIFVINGQKKGYGLGYIFEVCSKDIADINSMETVEKMADFFKKSFLKLSSIQDNSANIVLSAVRLIEKEYNKDISLAYIADKLHVHKSYLCRIFKEKVGENIVPYIENMKINKAKDLLCNSNKKLSEISNDLGYASATYFSYSFKKETGYSPSEYRKRKKESGELNV